METKAVATIQADALQVGDLLLCGTRFREVFSVEPRSEDADGKATELYVSVSDRDRRSRRMTVIASLTLTIRDRNR